MIIIIDYGMGNLGSLAHMITRMGGNCLISGDSRDIQSAEKLILPGVGAFDAAMKNIDALGLRPVLERKALEEKIPVLGICLGMQLLASASEEGVRPGLNWIPGTVNRFRPATPDIKVPHMGWNRVRIVRPTPLSAGLPEEARFYFVHSYFVQAADAQHQAMRTTHGIEFDSAIRSGNIYGVQFHPEKSHRFGMHLISNFVKL